MENDKLAILFEQYLSGRMSKIERAELRTLLQDPAHHEYFESLVNNSVTGYKADSISDPGKEKHIEKLFERIHVPQMPAVHRVHFLRRNWLRYAAAVIFIIGTGAYLWFKSTQGTNNLAADHNVPGFENVQAGKDKAVLTLADGSVIILESAGNGSIASQGNTEVIKLPNGRIIYNAGNSQETKAVMNTMSTPRGGKYQLTLPDGTRAWLNAASSITFPVVFTGKERSVKITGEVYFEVAADKSKPFSVIKENTQILVLGTDFNVNAYDDENNMKVTLLKGSVKVGDNQKQSAILTPGQQAQIGGDKLITVNNADIDKVMAWKNGLFNFEDAKLDEVMRQITRWYDINVIYENGVPDIQLWGKMSRNTNLSGLLKNLKDVGVKYKVNEAKRELVILR